MAIEGLVLSKIPYQERHLIVKLLTRDGTIRSLLFFGGKGGGAKNKGSVVELGYMLKVFIRPNNKNNDLLMTSDWKVIWHPEDIRGDYQAFTLLCFFVEVMTVLAIGGDKTDAEESRALDFHQEHSGLFRVLSNALFYLNQHSREKTLHLPNQILTYLAKLLLELGIFPGLDVCSISGEAFCGTELKVLLPDHGGFALAELSGVGGSEQDGNRLWQLLITIKSSKYQELVLPFNASEWMVKTLFDYFCFQFGLSAQKFKSYSFIF